MKKTRGIKSCESVSLMYTILAYSAVQVLQVQYFVLDPNSDPESNSFPFQLFLKGKSF
jgi:hypothetical protein